jgi:hypothetical protein
MFPGAKTTDDAWRSYNGRPATHAGRHVRLSVTGGQDMVLFSGRGALNSGLSCVYRFRNK